MKGDLHEKNTYFFDYAFRNYSNRFFCFSVMYYQGIFTCYSENTSLFHVYTTSHPHLLNRVLSNDFHLL